VSGNHDLPGIGADPPAVKEKRMKRPPISNPFDDEEAFTRNFRLAILGCGMLVCLGLSTLVIWRNQTEFVSLYGQYFPTPTFTLSPAPTLTATQTLTPTATFTPTPNLTATQAAFISTSTALALQSTATIAAREWQEIFTEAFDNNGQGWEEFSSDADYAKIAFAIKDGKYIWTATAHRDFIYWVTLPTKSVEDFSLSLQVKLGDNTDADYGIAFRIDDQGNCYYFAIDPSGGYALYKYVGE